MTINSAVPNADSLADLHSREYANVNSERMEIALDANSNRRFISSSIVSYKE